VESHSGVIDWSGSLYFGDELCLSFTTVSAVEKLLSTCFEQLHSEVFKYSPHW